MSSDQQRPATESVRHADPEGTDPRGEGRQGGEAQGAVTETLRSIRDRLRSLPQGQGTHYWLRADSDEDRRTYISANAPLLRAAAEDFGLPARMLAGIAWQEVDGDPRVVDDIAYHVRRVVPGLRSADKTSMGPLSVQVRRAAEVLGYDPRRLSGRRRRIVVSAVREPRQNIFIAAAYLAGLRSETDFAAVAPERLTRGQLQDLAARYNGGPFFRVTAAQAYGRAFAAHLDAATAALG